MPHVREVTNRGMTNGRERTHWVVDGPLGVPVAWDAVTTKLVPDEEIAWKSVEGAAVEQAGVIRLSATADRAARVDPRMSYSPPGGAAKVESLARPGTGAGGARMCAGSAGGIAPSRSQSVTCG